MINFNTPNDNINILKEAARSIHNIIERRKIKIEEMKKAAPS